MASLEENITKKTTTLKRKRVERISRDDESLFKRKLGLFNKVTELSILCQTEAALIVSSQTGELSACGYPNPDAVIQRFLSAGCLQEHACADRKKHQDSLEILRVQHEALEDKLKEEKEKLNNIIEAQKVGLLSPFWWNNNIEEMGLEDLEQFKASLEQLKLNLVVAVEGKRFNSMTPMPMHLTGVPVTSSSNHGLIYNVNFNKNEALDWNCRSSTNIITDSNGFYFNNRFS